MAGYFADHQAQVDNGFPGLLVLAEDFGAGGTEPPGGTVDIAQIDEMLANAQDQLGNPPDGLRFQRPSTSATKAQWIAWSDQVREHAGLAWEWVNQARGLLDPKAEPRPEPGQPPPSPAPLRGVYGTYFGHGLAVDCYPGRTDEEVQWGPHHGHPIVAPADGRVEVYAFGTPLETQSRREWTPEYAANWAVLATGMRCLIPQQTMYVAVWWPTGPYSVDGQQVGHLHYGHVRQDIRVGAVRQGEPFAVVWDSGVRFEPGNPVARASHTHCCAGAGTSLSPNGDLPGRLAVLAQGWTATDIGTVPGPTEYQQPNVWCAGRRYQDFVQAGRQPPPMPS